MILSKSGDDLVDISWHDESDRLKALTYWLVRVGLSITDDRTVQDFVDLHGDCHRATRIPDAEEGRETYELDDLYELLLRGHPDFLIGQKESSQIEAKSMLYNLNDHAGRIEIAQDIARFANSENGGLLVVGLRTKRTPYGEVINKITPIDYDESIVKRCHSVADDRIYPPIENLKVDLIPYKERALLAIRVPPQGENLKPFLVHGAIIDGKYEGGFISIVRRRDEHSIPVTGPAIHAFISAGRRAIYKSQDR